MVVCFFIFIFYFFNGPWVSVVRPEWLFFNRKTLIFFRISIRVRVRIRLLGLGLELGLGLGLELGLGLGLG